MNIIRVMRQAGLTKPVTSRDASQTTSTVVIGRQCCD